MRGFARVTMAGALGMLAAFGGVGTVASAATFPLTNDFSSTGFTNSTTQSGATLTLGSGVLNYVAVGPTSPASNPVTTASESITDIGTSDFIVSTRFTLNDNADAASLSTMGFGVFGAASDFGTSYYLCDWGVNGASTRGQLRIIGLGGAAVDAGSTAGDSDGAAPNGSSIVIGNTYELRLTGIWTGSTLNMTLAMFDGTGNPLGTAAIASDSSLAAGSFFGFRNRTVNGATTDVSYDNFSVAPVPEPASLGLVGLAGLLLRSRSRRQGGRRQVC